MNKETTVTDNKKDIENLLNDYYVPAIRRPEKTCEECRGHRVIESSRSLTGLAQCPACYGHGSVPDKSRPTIAEAIEAYAVARLRRAVETYVWDLLESNLVNYEDLVQAELLHTDFVEGRVR